MTRLRVVALAQTLTMSMLLLPGLTTLGPAAVGAALRPLEPSASAVFDQAGKGIGCQPSGRKYKGPGLRKDPPWPPGAEPTPSPEVTAAPEAAASPEATSSPPPADGTGQTEEPEAAAFGFVQGELEPAPVTRGKLLTGIDVSHHNGEIDYAAVREAGHRFVFAKATQDNDFIDPMFPTNLARARAAGLAVGAYHFFDYTLDGRAQADHFIDRVEVADGLDDALPPVIDVECWAPIGASIHAVSAARLRDLVERVYERTGRMPLIYTSVYMWDQVVGNAEGFADLPLWAACWGCEAPPSIAPGWESWTFWQEGLTRIPGVGRLDGNYFAGSGGDLRSLRLRPFAIAGGASATVGGTVELDLGGRDATHVRTSPDGLTWSAWTPVRSDPTVTIPREEGDHAVFAQLRYGQGLRSPVLSDAIVVDTTPPELLAPAVSLRTGPLGPDTASVPVTVRWQARDESAGLGAAGLAVTCGQGRTVRSEIPSTAGPGVSVGEAVDAFVVPDAACAVTAISRDAAGNSGREELDGVHAAILPAEGEAAGATVEAREVGIVARRGPDGGRAAVLLDGAAVALVDLYAELPTEPEVVHVEVLTPGVHELQLAATGSSHPASSGAAVAVEGYVTLGPGAAG